MREDQPSGAVGGSAPGVADHLPRWKLGPIVSSMESNSEAREDLHLIERAEVSPYVDYPPTPAWYPSAVGLFAGALVCAIALLLRTTWIGALAVIGLLVIEGAFLGWYQRYHGALPSLRNPPAEFRPLLWRFAVGYTAILLIVVALWFFAGWWAAAIGAALMTTAGVAVYERAYAATAARTKARLA